jgi:hypothetical protein
MANLSIQPVVGTQNVSATFLKHLLREFRLFVVLGMTFSLRLKTLSAFREIANIDPIDHIADRSRRYFDKLNLKHT